MITTANRLLKTISHSTSPFHTVLEAKKQLFEGGYQELDWNCGWNLEPGGKYFISPFHTTLFAFRINKSISKKDMIKIVTSHIDTPGIRIKANPDLRQGNYLKLNSEVYGGAILNTWLDRPLSLSGRVFLKGETPISPKTVYLDFKDPVLIIPNTSIHLNRSVNEGISLNPQIDMLPVFATTATDSERNNTSSFLLESIANFLFVEPESILSYDLCVYNWEKGCLCGRDKDFIVAPRIDNMSSVQASLTGLLNSTRDHGLDLIALFDHEEVGSHSANGAASNLLPMILERIYTSLHFTRADYLEALLNGFVLSLDVAHGTNPNHPEKYDITSSINLNDGIALKSTSKLNYCGDGETSAILLSLAKDNSLPLKPNFLRSDSPGGGTLGAILSSVLPMRYADVGAPVLAMHSSMETMGRKDQFVLEDFTTQFLTQL